MMERSRVENATWTLTSMSAPRIRLKGHQFHEISGFPVLPPREAHYGWTQAGIMGALGQNRGGQRLRDHAGEAS